MQNKLEKIILLNSNDLYEREEILRLIYIGLFAQENVFLLGPPGVAKSLISRRISHSISDSIYFEYLMNKFSTPEEIFGPISLKKLEEDKYERKIENYLPAANVAFLDEIWKSSSSIQNTLLTIINEKVFVNGTNIVNTPLYFLISASNEIPPLNEGFDALYDRFLLRILVSNIKNDDLFMKYLNSSTGDFNINNEDKISLLDIKKVQDKIEFIICSQNILKAILNIKKTFENINQEIKENSNDVDGFSDDDNEEVPIELPYISDRRWKKIMKFLKTNAVLSNRNSLSIYDLLLMTNLLWDKPEQIEPIKEIINNEIKMNVFDQNEQKLLSDYNGQKNETKSFADELVSDCFSSNSFLVDDFKNVEIDNNKFIVAYSKDEKIYYFIETAKLCSRQNSLCVAMVDHDENSGITIYKSKNKNVIENEYEKLDRFSFDFSQISYSNSQYNLSKQYKLLINKKRCYFLKVDDKHLISKVEDRISRIKNFTSFVKNLDESISQAEKEFNNLYSFGLDKSNSNFFNQIKNEIKKIKSENTRIIKKLESWIEIN